MKLAQGTYKRTTNDFEAFKIETICSIDVDTKNIPERIFLLFEIPTEKFEVRLPGVQAFLSVGGISRICFCHAEQIYTEFVCIRS